MRNQHVVHQRYGQIGRNQAGRRTADRQEKTEYDHAGVPPGEFAQPDQRRNGRDDRHGRTGGAFDLLGQERHPAARTNHRRVFTVPVRIGFAERFESLDQTMGGGIARRRVTPNRQATGVAEQLQRADASQFLESESQRRLVWPLPTVRRYHAGLAVGFDSYGRLPGRRGHALRTAEVSQSPANGGR